MTTHTSSVADGQSNPPENVAHPLLAKFIRIGDADEACVVPSGHCMYIVEGDGMFQLRFACNHNARCGIEGAYV